jgi:Zn-dependent protease with chaperone function
VSALRAVYHDGRSSRAREVTICVPSPGRLHVVGQDIDASWPLASVRASARIGDSRRYLYFPDGTQCETADNDGVDRLLGSHAPAAGRMLHRWESRYRTVLAALLLTVVTAWAAITLGIPALAKHVAFALPASTDALIGREALATLDRFLLGPTQLAAARQDALRALFSKMIAGGECAARCTLELRAGKQVGANALALPSGIVVLTDELVQLARDDREIVAVLAHEVGHLKQRHALRHLLQNSAVALLVAAMVGDITSITSLAATVPTVLLQAKFSRDFEREADDFALHYLDRNQIPVEAFAAILERIAEHGPASEKFPDYLSTHPASRDRLARARGAR